MPDTLTHYFLNVIYIMLRLVADRFQVPLNKGIPSLAVIDGSGKLITSQKQGEFESAAKIGIEDISAFLNHWNPSLPVTHP
jgi:hypothetical protein